MQRTRIRPYGEEAIAEAQMSSILGVGFLGPLRPIVTRNKMIQTEEQMYEVLMRLSNGLHEMEVCGIDLHPLVEQAWEEITSWLEAR